MHAVQEEPQTLNSGNSRNREIEQHMINAVQRAGASSWLQAE